MSGCANKNYEKDLLLIEKSFLEEQIRLQKISFPSNYKMPYQIKIWNDNEDFDVSFKI